MLNETLISAEIDDEKIQIHQLFRKADILYKEISLIRFYSTYGTIGGINKWEFIFNDSKSIKLKYRGNLDFERKLFKTLVNKDIKIQLIGENSAYYKELMCKD